MAEETGWTDIVLLREAARHSHVVTYLGHPVLQQERLYLARTEHPGRQIRGVDAMHAADGIAAWRWWTLPDLDISLDIVWPASLADMIRAELANGARQVSGHSAAHQGLGVEPGPSQSR
ncbi:MAG: hypothetical protein ACRDNZ_03030 [Streptosporangiaceae bacterium]